ncbi:MAG TPA: hypothetical protein VFW40_11475, partial [Capsulimonadaceae bacterium]|nr:hypothetical protein [Capsulimonadaceae bacterium]
MDSSIVSRFYEDLLSHTIDLLATAAQINDQDIANAARLTAELNHPNNTITRYVSQRIAAEYKWEKTRQQPYLDEYLNSLVSLPDFYQPSEFNQVVLRPATRRLLTQNPTGPKRFQL